MQGGILWSKKHSYGEYIKSKNKMLNVKTKVTFKKIKQLSYFGNLQKFTWQHIFPSAKNRKNIIKQQITDHFVSGLK